MTKILFILKRRPDYSQHPSYSQQGISTGLFNSASFVSEMLSRNGIESKLVVVIDNNCIDKEVTAFKPTHVIIEALWVVPEKFDVLTKLHPTVKWIVRYHSEAPFIANEGMATSWTFGYAKRPNVFLGINAPRFELDVRQMLFSGGLSHEEIDKKIIYLPNFYPVKKHVKAKRYDYSKQHVDVGCFGAIRPLKNHLVQALAALEFAEGIGKKLHFHINVGRTEMKGDPILHDLQGLFDNTKEQGHRLIMHQWVPHEDFIRIIEQMDIGLQVSFTETFNIVAADMVNSGIPIVVSEQVPWAMSCLADPTDSRDIARKMKKAWRFRCLNVWFNRHSLAHYSRDSKLCWLDAFSSSMYINTPN